MALDRQKERGLDTLAQQINEEHRAFMGSLRKTAEHGIRAGELLSEAKAQCRHGNWLPWLKENFEGSERTAQEYMRLYRYRDEVRAKTQHAAFLSIRGALRELEEATPDWSDEVDPEPATDHDAPPADAAKEAHYNNKIRENLVKEKKELQKAKRQVEEDKARVKKREEAAKKKLEEQQAQANAEFRETVKTSFEQQLLDIHARYGIQETPTIFEVDPEHWRAALENTKNRREEELVEIFSKFFPVVSTVRQYEPEEAAGGFLKWPSEERATEAVEEIGEWLVRVSEEMKARTTPGVLRAVGGKNTQKQ